MTNRTPPIPAAVALAIATLLCSSAYAQYYWDTNGPTGGSGNASGSWNTGTNWSINSGGTIGTIGWLDGNQARFSAGTDGVGTLTIGITGTVNPAGVVVEEGNIITSGNINSTSGILIQRGTAPTSLTLNGAGSTTATSVNIGNPLNIGGQTGTATLNVQDTHTLQVNGNMFIGEQNSHVGHVNQTGGSVTVTGTTRIGHWPNETSTYTISGGSFASDISVGWDGQGQLNISNGAIVNATNIRVSDNGAGSNNSSVTIDGVTTQVNVAFFGLGENNLGNNATVTQNNGTVTVSNRLQIGHWGNETSTYNMNAGTLNITGIPLAQVNQAAAAEQPGVIYVGVDGTGNFIQTGGNASATAIVLDARGNTAGTDTFTLNGGTMALGNATNGTTLANSGIFSGSNNGNTSFKINLGGGTLKANASWSSALPMELTGVNGNTTFDTNGNTITLNGATNGVGGLLKIGGGTLDMNGNHDYSGSTTVSGGTLSLTDGLLYTNNAWANRQITINNGAVVEVGGWADGDTAGLGRVAFAPGNILVDNGTIRYTGGSTTGNADRGFTIGAGGATLDASGTNNFTLNEGRGFGITSTSGGTLTLTGPNNGVMNMILGGTGGLTKEGTGTWTVSANNSFTGTTNANNGTLVFNTPNFNTYTGNGININNGSTVQITQSGGAVRYDFGTTWTFDNNGGGTINTGPGLNYVFSADNTYVTTGGVRNNINGSSGINMNGRNIVFDVAPGTDPTSDLNVALSMGNSAGSLTKQGNGTLTLTAGNTYSGATNVEGGRLVVSNTLRNSSGFNVDPGATLEFGATNIFTAGHGTPMGATRVIDVDNGTLLFNAAMDSRFGNVNLRNGATWTSNRVLTNFDALLANTTAGTATVTVSGTGASVMNGSGGIHLQGVQNFNVADTTSSAAVDLTVSMVLDGPGSAGGAAGGINKQGLGTMELTNANTYNGSTNVEGGILRVSNTLRNSSDFNVNGAGATLEFGATNIFVAGHGTPLADSRVIDVDGGTLLFNAAMDSRFGNVNLSNGATWTSNRGLVAFDALLANTVSGAATVDVSGTGTSLMNGTGGIHLQGVQNFNVADTTGNADADLIVSMILDGPGSTGGAAGGVNKTGAGRMDVSADNTYTGDTIINGGEFRQIGGSLQNANVQVNTGVFRQNAGTNNVNGAGSVNMNIANGAEYELNGGDLDFHDTDGGSDSTLNIVAGGTFDFNGGRLLDVTIIETNGGTFQQGDSLANGGRFVVGRDLVGVQTGPELTTINGGYTQLGGALALDVFGQLADEIDMLVVNGDVTMNGSIDANPNNVDVNPFEWYNAVKSGVGFEIALGSTFNINGFSFFRVIDDPSGQFGQILQIAVPEPASVLLWGLLGALLFGYVRRRKLAK